MLCWSVFDHRAKYYLTCYLMERLIILFDKEVEVNVKQSKSDQAVIRSILSLKIEGTFLDSKSEITLFEEIRDKSRSCYFEMRSNINPHKIGKRIASTTEINELLHLYKRLKLDNGQKIYVG